MKVGSNLYEGKKPEQPRWADGTRSFESVLSLFFNPPLLYCGNFQEIFLILLISIGNGKRTGWSPSDYKIGRPRSVSPILSQTAQTVQFFFLNCDLHMIKVYTPFSYPFNNVGTVPISRHHMCGRSKWIPGSSHISNFAYCYGLNFLRQWPFVVWP